MDAKATHKVVKVSTNSKLFCSLLSIVVLLIDTHVNAIKAENVSNCISLLQAFLSGRLSLRSQTEVLTTLTCDWKRMKERKKVKKCFQFLLLGRLFEAKLDAELERCESVT